MQEETEMPDKIYKYRMDYVYQQLVIYLVFFVLYALIRGKFFEEKFQLVFNDPLIYILIIFIVIYIIVVVIKILRARQIIIKSDRVVFKNRFGQREVLFSEINNIKIGRKRNRQDDPYRIIKLKLQNRKKLLKIRANDFERGSELIKEFLNIKYPGIA